MSPLKPVAESDLIQRCKRGDRDARRALYEKTAGRIYGLALRLTGNEQDAFDVAQNTYVRAFERLGQFDERSTFATWLYSIACNEARQLFRAAGRRESKAALVISNSHDPGPGRDADLRLDVDAALGKMPVEERDILLLRYHGGLDYRQIAEVLRCAPGTVASRLSRARSRLRAALAESYETSEEK